MENLGKKHHHQLSFGNFKGWSWNKIVRPISLNQCQFLMYVMNFFQTDSMTELTLSKCYAILRHTSLILLSCSRVIKYFVITLPRQQFKILIDSQNSALSWRLTISKKFTDLCFSNVLQFSYPIRVISSD